MRSYFSAFLIFGFTAIAVFGFLGMHFGGGHAHIGCLGNFSGTLPCAASNPLDLSIFHISVYKIFSTAIFAAPYLALRLLMVWVFAFLAVLISALSASRLIFARFSAKSPDLVFLPLKKSFLRWQALHSDLS